MRRGFWCSLSLVLLLSLLSAPALAARRVALVIGIGDYETLSKLANPVSDAKAIATVLRTNGFDVAEYYDVPRADLLDALESFRPEAEGASVALVYYAGHGMEIDGKNVLAPKDMEVDCEHVSPRRSLSLSELFSAIGGAEHEIVLLDACRNNPFPNCKRGDAGTGFNFREIVGEAKSEGHTLLIANSTLTDKLAADGVPGEHSPFAKALLTHFSAEANVPLRDVLDAAAEDVDHASGGSQIPEITTRGGAPRICLNESACGTQATNAPVKPEPGPAPPPSFDPAAEAWSAVKGTNSTAVLDLLIAKYPGTVYAELARERRDELKEPPPKPLPQSLPQPQPRVEAHPSFSCAMATVPAELAVCDSTLLASLDVQMAELYGKALLNGGSKYIRDQQRSLLKRRNACGSDSSCLEQRYREEIRFFKTNAGDSKEAENQPAQGHQFKTFASRDLTGPATDTIKVKEAAACEGACAAANGCVAYTFNAWNRICFLKATPGLLLLEPSSVSGVSARLRKGAWPIPSQQKAASVSCSHKRASIFPK
jgi:hypothetical protein